MIGEPAFKARAGQIIVSGYNSVCFEIKFSGRHRGFDGVLICDHWLMLRLEILSISSCSKLEPLILDGLLLYAWPVINGSVHTHH